MGEYKPETKKHWAYNFFDKYSDQGWIDVVIDLATLILFAWATWLAFSTIMAAPPEVFASAKE